MKCISINLPCDDKCFENRHMCCDGLCKIYHNLQMNGTWLCNGKCQSWPEPCNDTCHTKSWKVNCKNQCEGQRTMHECNGNCFTFDMPPYNGTCQEDIYPRYSDCNGVCKISDDRLDETGNWLCNGKCQSIAKACNGVCQKKNVLPNCNVDCGKDSSKHPCRLWWQVSKGQPAMQWRLQNV